MTMMSDRENADVIFRHDAVGDLIRKARAQDSATDTVIDHRGGHGPSLDTVEDY